MKERTFAIVGTNKETKIRKTIVGGISTREDAERLRSSLVNDKYIKKVYRFVTVVRDGYKPRK